MMESDSFNNERSGNVPFAQRSKGIPVNTAIDCHKIFLFVFALNFTPRKQQPEWIFPEKLLWHQLGNTSCKDDISDNQQDI